MTMQMFYSVKKVFGLTEEEFTTFFNNVSSLLNGYSEEAILDIFSERNLYTLYNCFISYGLVDIIIKKIIVKAPKILFKSIELTNLFLIYKNNKIKGFINVNDSDFEAYMVDNEYSRVMKDNSIVELMVDSLYRNDYIESLNIDPKYLDNYNLIKKNELLDDTEFKTTITYLLKLLERDYSKKNYYIKKHESEYTKKR